VLVQDFLFKKSLSCQDALKEAVLRHKSRLQSEFVKAKIKLGEPISESAAKQALKYVRVNTLRTDITKAIKRLQDLGFKLKEDLHEIVKDGGACFAVDKHIANLLTFPCNTNLSSNQMYLDGSLIIQDKASCMPAFLLDPPPGSHVVDSCAAPGNKTSHLAAIVGPSGQIHAFERDEKRYETLVKMLNRAGCNHVVPTCADFLTLNPLDPKYADVEYCLVDPSCSGSGIIKEHENISASQPESKDRLQKLSNFQKMIIRHAMKFPSLKRLVYSTCSVHEEENEMVVQEVLKNEPGFRLVENPLPSWHRRGLSKYEFGQHLVRADPYEDGIHGFFVALFTKV
jgi:putative methyltransferase